MLTIVDHDQSARFTDHIDQRSQWVVAHRWTIGDGARDRHRNQGRIGHRGEIDPPRSIALPLTPFGEICLAVALSNFDRETRLPCPSRTDQRDQAAGRESTERLVTDFMPSDEAIPRLRKV